MNKKYLLITLIALFAMLVSACAGAAVETPAAQTDDSQAGAPSVTESQADNNDNAASQTRQDNPQPGREDQGGRGKRDMTAAAETLGVTVEDLQAAFQSAIPAECTSTDGQPNRDPNCRPDLNVVAETLGVTVEELQAALGNSNRDGRGDRGERDLTAAAEALGVTVEELQSAFDAAKPAECIDSEPAQGVDCLPDMDAVANVLGITIEELQAALGNKNKGLDFAAAAETLGVTEEELQQAFEAARPAECAAAEEGAPKDPNCRADLDTVASTLGVTVEELQAAFGKNEGGRGPQGGQPPVQP